jgi:hypothetical protein
MTLSEFESLTAGIESIVTITALVLGGDGHIVNLYVNEKIILVLILTLMLIFRDSGTVVVRFSYGIFGEQRACTARG